MERVLVVSNRLPVTITHRAEKSDDGSNWQLSMSSGGLVSALILWPLFHYLPGEVDFDEVQFDAYEKANREFARVLSEIVRDGDFIWVHDYHLMLLPKMLREFLASSVNVHIGFFLHTPFPSSEVYGILPVRKQILAGILECDVIGFHTFDYARHFLSSCARILGLSTFPESVEYEGRRVKVGVFPIGIDPEQFRNVYFSHAKALELQSVKEKVAFRRDMFKGKKIFLGVDRMDYIKGVPHKLHAFHDFLEKYPEFRQKVVLIQVAVPSRTSVHEYKNLASTVNELVGRINGKFGTVEFTPIHFLNKSVSFEDLVALYTISDVCIVSSTRDGMNLVSYEYIACQNDNPGVLVLSEFAGAAQSLNGAIIVNPWSSDELVNAYHEALTMSEEARSWNIHNLTRYVNKHTASFWGESFINELRRVGMENVNKRKLPKLTTNILLCALQSLNMTSTPKEAWVIFIEYEGVLVSKHESLPELALPSKRTFSLVEKLSKRATVVVFSGHSRNRLARNLGGLHVALCAENGGFLRRAGASEWEEMVAAEDRQDLRWKELAMPLIAHSQERTPGSYIEEKEISVTWNFRNSDREFGRWQASELKINLEKVVGHLSVEIFVGNQVLELRPLSADRAEAGSRFLQSGVFPLCLCESKLGERLFRAVNSARGLTCTVGKKETEAKFYVDDRQEMLEMLSAVCE